ncbi:tyrosine-type recombinase/integrase [Dechloromonas hortensis]|uniref:tyrosine-type recombinase/integrase n=1 Tax=Dechloromonas hortensis TaxID=337779 RepID=UPI0012928DAF|nr:tyrosine-type recombinase/integrase [Dechloromonas hortensis]
MTTEITTYAPQYVPRPAEFALAPADRDLPPGHRPHQLRAQNDREAVAAWLNRYRNHAKTTQDNYRREAERLILWMEQEGLTLNTLMIEDLDDFLVWLADPQPRAIWCVVQDPQLTDPRSIKLPARFLDKAKTQLNPEWRPFLSGLSASSIAMTRRCLNCLFEYLAGANYVRANLMRLAMRGPGASQQVATVTRYLEPAIWDYLQGYVERLPRETDMAVAQYYRIRFLLAWYYLLGLRISEMADATTDNIIYKHGILCLHVVGKRNKSADLVLIDDALAALREYRISLGKREMPTPGITEEPIVFDVHGKRPVTVKSLHAVIKGLFRGAAAEAAPHVRRVLEQASTHWLRHTAASAMCEEGVPLEVVRDQMRHSDLKTTSLYVHNHEAKMSEALKAHKLRR